MSVLATTRRRIPRSVVISAWAVPVLVIGRFSMLAIIPVALVLVGTLRRPELRHLRPYSVALAAIYATPLAIWALRPDGAPSLSKDMHPVFLVLIVAAAAALLLKLHTTSKEI